MSDIIDVREILIRLKKLVGVYSDVELAKHLGVTASNISSWRRRNSPPYKKCIEIALEQGVSIDWLLFGTDSSGRDSEALSEQAEGAPRRPTAQRSSGFSDIQEPNPQNWAHRDEENSLINPPPLDGSSSIEQGNLVLIDGPYRADGDILKRSLYHFLLMLHDSETIDLREAQATVIVDAFMRAVYRNMRERHQAET